MKLKKKLFRKKRKKESWFKYIMSVLHLWLGLLSSIVILIVSLSGSIYAFKQQIEDAVNYDYAFVQSHQQQKVPLDSLLASFEVEFGKATFVKVFPNPNRAVLISSFSKNNAGTFAYYNPYTGQKTGVQNQSWNDFLSLVLDLHRNLWAGEVGKFINGIAVLILVFMLFSGFILWLPKKLKNLKKRLVIRYKAKFYRVNYDLHSVIGLYLIPLLLLISVTGLYVSFHWVKNGLIVGLGGDSIVISENNLALKANLSNAFNQALQNLQEERLSNTDATWSLQTIVDTSHCHFPNNGVLTVKLPNEQIKDISVVKVNTQNALGLLLPDRLEFAPTGKLREKIPYQELPLHEQFKAIAKPLHTGEIMGLPSIILYALASLLGFTLPITGFIIWWKKR